jgi:hypothetical protein
MSVDLFTLLDIVLRRHSCFAVRCGAQAHHWEDRETMRIVIVLLLLCCASLQPALAQALPPNTIPCKDFIKNSDGSWTAMPMTRSFNIGNLHNYTLESGNISENEFRVGGVDLWYVIEKKCNGFGIDGRSNSVGTFSN